MKNSNMKGTTMANRTNWEFFNPTELTLKIVHGYGGTVSNAEMHFTTTTDGDVNLDLLRPKLIPDIHCDLTKLSDDLTKVSQVQCFRVPQADGTLRCRIEITREDEGREIIQCGEIEGLPA